MERLGYFMHLSHATPLFTPTCLALALALSLASPSTAHASGPLAEFGVNGKITLSGGDNIREDEDSKRDIAADRIPAGTRILELEHTNNLRPGIVKGPRSGVTVGNRGKARWGSRDSANRSP